MKKFNKKKYCFFLRKYGINKLEDLSSRQDIHDYISANYYRIFYLIKTKQNIINHDAKFYNRYKLMLKTIYINCKNNMINLEDKKICDIVYFNMLLDKKETDSILINKI